MRKVLLGILTAAVLFVGRPLTIADTLKLRHLLAVYSDEKGSGLKLPQGVACTDKSLLVADTGNSRLIRYTYQDKAVKGGTEIRVPQLSAPVRVQLDSKGEIYALDGKERRIVHLSPEGEFKRFITPAGAPSPTTSVIRSFKIDSADNIYILDVYSGRVLIVDKEGKFQRAVGLPKGVGFVTDVAVDSTGRILAVDSLRRMVYSAAKDAAGFTLLGKDLTDSIGTLPDYITAVRGTIFLVEGKGSSIIALGQDGSYLSRLLAAGWKEGFLNYPCQMCINEKDEVFIADRDNSRVQIFSLTR